MRLFSLDICNFRVLRRVHLDFPDAIIGIIGRNGSGKSSIVEAIAWALYGHQVARSGKDEIKSSFARASDDCAVTLEFQLNGEHYSLARRLAGKSERQDVVLYRDGVSESVGSTETRNYVGQLLGLDWRGFLTSFLARQQELNALSDLQPSKRREHLAGMLGIERLDRAIQQLKEDSRVHGEKAGLMERRLAQREPLEVRLEELREHIESLLRQQDTQSGALQNARRNLEEVTARYREHEERRTACSQLMVRVEAQQATATDLEEQIRDLSAEMLALGKAAEELRAAETALEGLQSLRDRLEGLKDVRSRAAHRAAIAEQAETEKVDLSGLGQKLDENQRTLEGLKTSLADIPGDIDERQLAGVEKLELTRNEWSRLQAESQTVERELSKLQEQIASIKDIGPEAVCDRCLRPFGDDLPAIRKHLDEELEQLSARRRVAREEMSVKRADGEKLKQEAAHLDRQLKKKIELEARLQAAHAEEGDLRKRLNTAEERLQTLTARLTELGESRFDQAEFDAVSGKVGELEKLSERRSQLVGSLKRAKQAGVELRRSEEKLSAVREEVKRNQNEVQRLGYDETEFQRTSAALTTAQEQFEKAKEVTVGIGKSLELARQELQLKQEQLSELQQAADELEEMRESKFYGERLGGLFADFRKHLIARIRPRLSELSGELLSEMTDGKYSLVELDEEYNLSVLDYSQYFGIDRFSGGERDLANLCLRLAISLALSESAGLKRSFIILDEVFGSQDDERRDLIFKGLINLKDRFPQMLLITHIEEIKDKVESLVELRSTEAGWSEVIVDGNTV